ncbi:heat shock cognate 71 kDa protein [Elysia marginata]|uniref:Heat shock cognate 71 kDa protein n=1 Tax=Elysia marginata TaxID=1093978 RepID=A0AAV4EYJ8_9GAST|nr:heat shock cognate 71 kDa protein [Elysia marginata]
MAHSPISKLHRQHISLLVSVVRACHVLHCLQQIEEAVVICDSRCDCKHGYRIRTWISSRNKKNKPQTRGQANPKLIYIYYFTNNFGVYRGIFASTKNQPEAKFDKAVLIFHYKYNSRLEYLQSELDSHSVNQVKKKFYSEMTKPSKAPAIGIDLGTTYSCVGVFQHVRLKLFESVI